MLWRLSVKEVSVYGTISIYLIVLLDCYYSKDSYFEWYGQKCVFHNQVILLYPILS